MWAQTVTCGELFLQEQGAHARTTHVRTLQVQQEEGRPVSKQTESTSKRYTQEDVDSIRARATMFLISSRQGDVVAAPTWGGDAKTQGPPHAPSQAKWHSPSPCN